MTISAQDVRSKLESKLTSSVPLSNKCHLAVNIISSHIYIPGKEELILSWILKTLDKKYNERIKNKKTDDDKEDIQLWRTLSTCLSQLDLDHGAVIDWTQVGETLTNVLPHSDLGMEDVFSCVLQLVSMSCQQCSSHGVIWACVITSLLTHSLKVVRESGQFLQHLFTILDQLEIDVSQDYSEFILALSQLYKTHPHDSIKKVTRRLLFPTPDPYIQLFAHVSCETPGKYQPGHVVSLLCNVVTQQPEVGPLLLSSCPDHPDWLHHKLFSFILSCHGFPGIVDQTSIIGSKLLSAKKTNLKVSKVFKSAFPLNLEFILSEKQNVGQYLQEVLHQFISKDGVTEDVCEAVDQVHQHYPQLLEPLVGLILEKRLLKPCPEYHSVFKSVIDVMMKFRQLPKLVSKLFLHLRGIQSLNLQWNDQDLRLLGDSISSIPKVQCLELWKCLNYHFSADVLQSSSSSEMMANVLGPLLCSVLTNIHIVDHNTPASLVPRIQDLMRITLKNLQEFQDKTPSNKLFVQVSCALRQFAELLLHYRNVSSKSDTDICVASKEFSSLYGNVAVEQQIYNSQALFFLLDQDSCLSAFKPGKSSDKSGLYSELGRQLSLDPSLMESIPNEVLLLFIQSEQYDLAKMNVLKENVSFCAGVLCFLIGKLNKEEIFYVPAFNQWAQNGFNSLDSDLGKSFCQAATSVAHFQDEKFRSTNLLNSDWKLLDFLPLEHLPPVLKIGATLICITAIFSGEELTEEKILLCARCLESTDLFRYLDAAMFLEKLININVPDYFLEVAAKSAGRYTKTVNDVDRSFALIEQNENLNALKTCLYLLQSLERSLVDNIGGEEKVAVCKSLAGKLSKFVFKMFKKRVEENTEELNLFCKLAASLQNIYAREGLGKMGKFINKMLKVCLTDECSSWMCLMESTAKNIDHLDITFLPEDWKLNTMKKIQSNFTIESVGLLKTLFKTASAEELRSMMENLNSSSGTNLALLSAIIRAEVNAENVGVKKEGVEIAVGNVCLNASEYPDENIILLPELLMSIFTSSPPCVSHQMEVSCLGCLVTLPQHLAPKSLQTLSAFISHRPNLSLSVIPITFSIIRKFISGSSSPDLPTLQALQKVLGLFSRHKADYSPVLPFLIADLLTLLQSLPFDKRGILTTSLYPLLDMLEKHSFSYLSSNLSPSTNELFKAILETYNSSHKFKGKV